ncbi:MAG TPA: hypothetical protein DCZ94_02400 [Lentisphaeria bacterium]|nr:MAG: hypothetical protein A2X48_16150 [Lentisphaerae bacterium GWF2_49_21]HBC85785.1 hypothetical protein [Lentisphaeria bacterium]
MKKMLALLVAVGLVTGIAAFADGEKKAEKADKGDKKVEAAAAGAKEIEITGKVVKGEKEGTFALEMADGKAMLPKVKDDAMNPEKFLDKNVTVKGKGITKEPKEGKEGKKMVKVIEITSIAEAAAK